MKSAFFTLFTLAAGVFAGPVPVAPSATREVATAVETKVTLVHLTETIKTYTGAISKFIDTPQEYLSTRICILTKRVFLTIDSTVSNVGSKSLTTTEQTSLVNELLPQFEGISSVLQIAVKSATGSDFTVGLSATSDILEAVEGLVSELLYTVISVIKITGLGTKSSLHLLFFF